MSWLDWDPAPPFRRNVAGATVVGDGAATAGGVGSGGVGNGGEGTGGDDAALGPGGALMGASMGALTVALVVGAVVESQSLLQKGGSMTGLGGGLGGCLGRITFARVAPAKGREHECGWWEWEWWECGGGSVSGESALDMALGSVLGAPGIGVEDVGGLDVGCSLDVVLGVVGGFDAGCSACFCACCR